MEGDDSAATTTTSTTKSNSDIIAQTRRLDEMPQHIAKARYVISPKNTNDFEFGTVNQMDSEQIPKITNKNYLSYK